MIGILFDLDGTLVDSSQGILDSLHFMLAEMNAPPRSGDELRSWIGPPLQSCAEHLTGNSDPAEIERAVQAYRGRYRDVGVHQTKLFEGIESLVRNLAARSDLRLGVATSKPTDFALQILAQHQLDGVLPVLCGADWEGRLSKADLIAQAVSEMGVVAEQSVMVGDRKFDVEGAHQHGLSAVGVSYGFGEREELEAAGADVVCDSVAELQSSLTNFLAC